MELSPQNICGLAIYAQADESSRLGVRHRAESAQAREIAF